MTLFKVILLFASHTDVAQLPSQSFLLPSDLLNFKQSFKVYDQNLFIISITE